MAIVANLFASVTLQGGAIVVPAIFSGGGNVAQNNNAAAPTVAVLSAGNNTQTAPSGVTVNGVLVIPPSGSVNTKVYKGVSGDTGFSGTAQPAILPVAAGGTFVINSVGTETVQLVYF